MQSPLDVLKQLKACFPQKDIKYLGKAASYYAYHLQSLDDFVTGGLVNRSFPAIPDGYQYVIDGQQQISNYIQEKVRLLCELVPDADDEFLKVCIEDNIGAADVVQFAYDIVMSMPYPYPKKAVLVTSKPFDVARYVSLVPDPMSSYNHKNYIWTKDMLYDAVSYLSAVFPNHMVSDITNIVEEKESLYLSFLELLNNGSRDGLRFPKLDQPTRFDKPDETMCLEKLFIEHKKTICDYIRRKKLEKSARQECEICASLVPSLRMLEMCERGHLSCFRCVKRGTELKYHEGTVWFFCFNSDCNRPIRDIAIQKTWDTHLFSALLQKRMFLSKTKINQVMCPVCLFPNNGSNMLTIRCTHCKETFCKDCRKKSHAPRLCGEVEDSICKKVEEAMSMEVIRICPKCQAPLVKEPDSCNRIECKCKTNICYICRKVVSGTNYVHFYGQGTMPSPGKCPLFSDINHLHVQRVIESGKKALEQYKGEHPDMQLGYNPLRVLPKAEKSDAVPNMY